MVVVAGFLGWHWYQERLLWDAAKFHYLGQLQKSNERFQRAVRACEAEAREEGFGLEQGEWKPDHIWLQRGRNLDPGLAWLRDYQFYVVLIQADPNRVYLSCTYNVDREEVEAISRPDGVADL